MIYPPLSELVEKTKTRYSLVILTSKRARQLGARKEGEFYGRFDKAILEAVKEVHQGKVFAEENDFYKEGE